MDGGSGGDAFADGEAGRGEVRLSSRLSARELEILDLVQDGLTNREISERIGIAETSVKGALSRLMRRYDCRNRIQLLVVLLRCPSSEADGLGEGLN